MVKDRAYQGTGLDSPDNKQETREHAPLGTTIMKRPSQVHLIVKRLLTLLLTLAKHSGQRHHSLCFLFFFFFCSRQYPKTTSHNMSLPKNAACLHACMYSIICNFPIEALFVMSHVAVCRTNVVCSCVMVI